MNTQNQYDPYAIFQQQPEYDKNLTDLSGVNPVMQNLAGQKSMMQNNTSQLGSLAQAAYNTKGEVKPYDPSAMAKLLRTSSDEQTANQPAPIYDFSQPMPDSQPNTQPNAMSPTDPYQEMMKKYYGNSYDPNAGWSA